MTLTDFLVYLLLGSLGVSAVAFTAAALLLLALGGLALQEKLSPSD